MYANRKYNMLAVSQYLTTCLHGQHVIRAWHAPVVGPWFLSRQLTRLRRFWRLAYSILRRYWW